ncbi:MAG: hypothetical protein MZW92_20460 [Comamonadaceae bacterium]|nr:hypothetical protein [Comamonadaceae bacterium]
MTRLLRRRPDERRAAPSPHPGALLITGLTSLQSVHTADVADLAGDPLRLEQDPGAGRPSTWRARRTIPLLRTPHGMFEACGVLHGAGLPRAVEV